jgi:hypothetical protein
MQLTKVVLPAPFGPMRPTISPGATSSAIVLTATTPPKRIVTSLAASATRSPPLRSRPPQTVRPPSTGSSMPVMNSASSDAR